MYVSVCAGGGGGVVVVIVGPPARDVASKLVAAGRNGKNAAPPFAEPWQRRSVPPRVGSQEPLIDLDLLVCCCGKMVLRKLCTRCDVARLRVVLRLN